MEASDFEGAMAILEPLERTPDTEAQWLQLADAALAAVASSGPSRILPLLQVAERCFAAVGNIARAAYLRRISVQYSAGLGGDAPATVRAEVSIFL
jgi:intraflagellar transport protein 172